MRRLTLIICCLFAANAWADPYAAGYARALLDERFPNHELRVLESGDGLSIAGDACLDEQQREATTQALLARSGVAAVEWQVDCPEQDSLVAAGEPPEQQPFNIQVLPQYPVFESLRADAREPQFSVRYQRHEIGDETFNAGDVSFGAYFGLAEGDAGKARYQLGIQGAVFALFNLDAASNDLVNADYWIGIPYSYRREEWSYRVRIYHQSSHLGDEFLLRNPDVERVNLSYEAVDGLLAYQWRGLRLYAGGGYILHSEPDLEPGEVQYGLEYEHPNLLGDANLVLAADFKRNEEQDWEINRSYRAGFSVTRRNREIGLLLEHYRGFSPNGQFFTKQVEYTGLGLFFGL